MEIGPAGCEQFQAGCNVAVPPDGIGVVVGMIDLEGIEPRSHVCRDVRIDVRLPRMSKRRQTARAVHDVDHYAWRRTTSRNECRAAGCQPAIKRPASIGDIPRRHHRPRDLRSPDGTSALLPGLHQYSSEINRHPKLRQPQSVLLDACYPLRALRCEERRQLGVAWIDEVPEQMYVAATLDGGDFDTRNDLDAARLRR